MLCHTMSEETARKTYAKVYYNENYKCKVKNKDIIYTSIIFHLK